MAQAKTQADQRRDRVVRDQFNRKWLVAIEIATGEATGAITKVGGWKDPLKTPQHFLRLAKDQDGFSTFSLEIQFTDWLAQQRDAETKWYDSLPEIALRIYKRLDRNEGGLLEYDPLISREAGRKPWPSSAVIQAAMNGDKQYLGIDPLDDDHKRALGLSVVTDAPARVAAAPVTVDLPREAAIPAAPDVWQEFMSWYFKYFSKNMAAAAAAWKEHCEAKNHAVVAA